MKGELIMTRKEAVKAAIKGTVRLGLEYSKRVGLVVGVSGVVLIGIALIKPNFYKDIDQK
jgi:hypothetical protein